MSYEDDEYDQYDQDEYDDHDYEEKNEFVAEVAAIERVGGGRPKFIDIEINIEKGRK